MITLRSKKEDITIHFLVLIGLSILTIILFYKFSTEDSYITYRYAQNLVDGHGFVYNPGEEFLGTTAPLYGLILAFFGFLGLPIPTVGGVEFRCGRNNRGSGNRADLLLLPQSFDSDQSHASYIQKEKQSRGHLSSEEITYR